MKRHFSIVLIILFSLAIPCLLNAAEVTQNAEGKASTMNEKSMNSATADASASTDNMIEITKKPQLRIETDKGIIIVELYTEEAPKTVENFLQLTKVGFYNGLKFHRVIPGFVAQSGDPFTKGVYGEDWTLDEKEHFELGLPLAGTGGPGYKIKAEFNDRNHVLGTLSMARSQDPDSAGSQFYICLAPLPYLDGQYTVFGQVIEGIGNVQKLEVGDKINKMVIVGQEKIPKAKAETAKSEAAVPGNEVPATKNTAVEKAPTADKTVTENKQ